MARILDVHLHLWDPAARHHDRLEGLPSLQRRFGPGDVDAGRHELVGAVFAQADRREDEALGEVRWVAAVVSVRLGARSADQIERNVDLYRRSILAGLWRELGSEGLLRHEAPTPPR